MIIRAQKIHSKTALCCANIPPQAHVGIIDNTTMKNSNTIKCELCCFTLPVNAKVCPNCGMNLVSNKLKEEIPRASPGPKNSAGTTLVKQPKGDRTARRHPDESAPRFLPELAVASINLAEFERDRGGIKQSQLEDSLVQNVQVEVLDPQVSEPVIAFPQAYVALIHPISQLDSLHTPLSQRFSRVWILSAVLLAGLILLSLGYFGKSNQLAAMSGDRRNLQTIVLAQDESLRQAESTISAQQNTISAQQTHSASQIDLAGTLLLGPLDGVLIHTNNGLIKTYWADQVSKNFILNVVLVNPYPAAFHSWSTCIRFRRNYTDEYRLTIFSTQKWELVFGLTTQPVASGTLTNLRTGEGGSNTVYLDVRDGIASLKVNDVLVPSMDVSAYQEAGDIGIAIGSRLGDELDGKTTIFKEFMLWEIP